MRYSQRAAFLNQVKQAKSAGALSRIYWVAVFQDYERAQIIEELLQLITPGREHVQRWTEPDLVALQNHLQAPNLFGDEPVAVVEGSEGIVKADAAQFERLFPHDFGILIFGAASKSSLLTAVEAKGVVLDLLVEKSWDREKRIQQTLDAFVRAHGKTIASNALTQLMDSQDLDEGILTREVEKLLSYTGDRLHIGVEDVHAVCPSHRSYAVWQTAEKVVWEGQGRLLEAHFHALVPALRSQLQLGLKIATLLAENASPEEWSEKLPKVFPKTLEKRTRDAHRLGASYFMRGLEIIFDIELQSRTGSQNLGALLDFFHCALYSRV